MTLSPIHMFALRGQFAVLQCRVAAFGTNARLSERRRGAKVVGDELQYIVSPAVLQAVTELVKDTIEAGTPRQGAAGGGAAGGAAGIAARRALSPPPGAAAAATRATLSVGGGGGAVARRA